MARTPYIVPALTKHTATVIMAHGLGDSGAGWVSLAQTWRRRGKFDEVAFIFPNAPEIPITVNFGMSMPGWYDIAKLGGNMNLEESVRTQDETGIIRSRDYFNALINTEIETKNIKASRIILGGFSQGGAMSVFTGVTNKEKLGGVFGMSCYMLLSDRIKNYIPEEWANKKTPFFLAHGLKDEVVPFKSGKASAEELKKIGLENVSFSEYENLGHSATPEEIDDIEKFIEKVLAAEGESTPSAGL
ncbi:Phospholipase/carboxylesterase/thioesterase [Penicillium vulpinum]|uniref:Phospholipase/carboxylesterase/thioesterase n=1 Tax=Penicillium vulpinum TaxID=29845 RepID=UPI002547E764|nr:Phospholipase/carboxylesterase/thioesterase [Penicillium vulpinum]KAJ5952934.1 Phospholipase/carboxylesterase/thioesterase [Penicillium vulpinum]